MNSFSHQHSSIDDCRILDIATFESSHGRLSVMSNTATAPLEIRRVYYIYDVPAGAERGGHSHHCQRSVIVALSGSFEVVIDDGQRSRRVTLNRPDCGLLVTEGIWRMIDNFSSGAVCLVLASNRYDEADYVRDYDEFKRLTAEKS